MHRQSVEEKSKTCSVGRKVTLRAGPDYTTVSGQKALREKISHKVERSTLVFLYHNSV